jgi:hypothetical protein
MTPCSGAFIIARTDVAKEAADVILVDDELGTLIPAVEEGKTIFYNVRSFLAFRLSTAAAELALITISALGGKAAPLNTMQILFINILSLGVDPPDPAVMHRPPRRKDEPILTQALLTRVAFSATIVALGTLFIYGYALGDAHMSRREQTMVSSACIPWTCARLADPLVCRRSLRSCSSTWCPRSRTAGSGARSAETGCCSVPSARRKSRSCTSRRCRRSSRRRRSGAGTWRSRSR